MRSIWTSLLTTFALSASAYAASCSTLGPGGSDSFTGQFTITARGTTGALTPLHLIKFLDVPGQSFHALSSGTSPTVIFTDFTMSGGLITAVTPPGSSFSAAQSLGAVHLDSTDFPEPGPFLMWANTFAPPSEIFCAVPQSDGTTVLALNGHSDLFVLCQADMSSSASNVHVIAYNATLSAYELGVETYNGNTCVSVTLLAVPV